ncbi:FkbM family methyltransferase [Tolypothrix sp. FACHB-123]|uniref:FkbM family methyltransferase n=1 Tax=Tolypothrix sp. FACHB-123 TaxID=2692868 RepID=UPI001683ABDD|nr:FkbM family methyltransferase [Tolypothrix sp. FACHB-123]MBD2355806.1 FkbM family methyltransferase [Tolypothrix sp. FACHB-123]
MVARLDNGIFITVDVKDYNGRMLYLCGMAYPEVVDTCRYLLRSGDCFLDIGANYGAVGLSCSDIVGADGGVYLFEPQPNLCQRLRAAIEEQNLSRVQLHEVGLMDRDDVLEMSLLDNHSGEASFVFNQQESANKIRLEVKNIATYLPPLLAGRSFGSKVDVEGAEPYLLPWLIQQQQMRFVVFENTHLPIQERKHLFESMTGNGFTLFGVKNKGSQTYLDHFSDPEDYSRYHDLLAVRIKPSLSIPHRLRPDILHTLQQT